MNKKDKIEKMTPIESFEAYMETDGKDNFKRFLAKEKRKEAMNKLKGAIDENIDVFKRLKDK